MSEPFHNNDTELLLLMSMDDSHAFEAVYRKYARVLYQYARRNIDTKEDCEEIIQDVFTSLWHRRQTAHRIKTLEAYLFRMVRYMIVRYFQRNTMKKKYAEHFRLFEAVFESNQDNDSESGLPAIIARAVKQLPDRCQQVLQLRLTQNLSNADIASRMKIKKSTVENYIVTALSHLRAAVHSKS